VRWEGYVVRVALNEDDYMRMGYMAANILIKMENNDQEGVYGADLGLSLSEETLKTLQINIDGLHSGDKIEYEASIE
jgi:hypothetical protein